MLCAAKIKKCWIYVINSTITLSRTCHDIYILVCHIIEVINLYSNRYILPIIPWNSFTTFYNKNYNREIQRTIYVLVLSTNHRLV